MLGNTDVVCAQLSLCVDAGQITIIILKLHADKALILYRMHMCVAKPLEKWPMDWLGYLWLHNSAL